MAGRGRGRGQSVSFNIEQLGFGRGEAIPVSVTQPPPTFPPLENRPLPLVKDVESDYTLVTHKDLGTRMRNSPFFLRPDQTSKDSRNLPVLWDRMPVELKQGVALKRSLGTKDGTKLKKGKSDAEKIFARLEAKEKAGGMEEDNDEKDQDEEKEQSDEERLELDEDAENELDEEMDEGTDYAREYFDNGENYLDEDDNGDDGEAIF